MERTRSTLKIFSFLAILSWVLMMGFLFEKTYIRPVSHKISWRGGGGLEVNPGEQWMGIYFQEKKIGYAFTGWEKEGLDLRLLERTVMNLTVMGQPQTVHVPPNACLDPGAAAEVFRFLLTSDQVNFQAMGEVKGKQMEVRLLGVGENKVAGLLRPTSGSIILAGFDLEREPVAAKSRFRLVPDRPFLYEKLTGREYLAFMAALYGIDGKEDHGKIEELLALFELEDWGDELVEAFSHGMRQRLVTCGALIHRPRVLIVDEPMVGLDYQGRAAGEGDLPGTVESGSIAVYVHP